MASSLPPPATHWTNRGALRWVRRYLGYSRAEARGLALLLLLIVGLLFVPRLLRPPLPHYPPAADQRQLDQLVAALHEHRVRPGQAATAGRYPSRPSVPRVALAPFDPNALTAPDWEARGVPPYVAGRMVRYREAAGGFRSKAQIKKMYGLDDSVYRRLAPFMQLPDEAPHPGRAAASARPAQDGPPGRYPRKPRYLQPFDLNTADTTQLMQIRGIGRWKALAVVKQRNLLGGFIHENQLADIWALREAPDLVDSLRKYTFVAPDFRPSLVPLNTASFDEMCFHPYIRKPLARAIVAWRNQHGPFKTVDELRQIAFLKAEDLDKLRPYLHCN